MSDPHEAFLRRLAADQSWIADMLDHQLEINDGAMLPIMLMSYVTAEALRRVTDSPGAVRALADFLEGEFGRDDDVDELIAYEFLDSLPDPGQPGAEARAMLGPALRAELVRREQVADRDVETDG